MGPQPGLFARVAELQSHSDLPDDVYEHTSKGNTVAVVSDGRLSWPGRHRLKSCSARDGGQEHTLQRVRRNRRFQAIDTYDVDEIVKTIVNISPTFGGINLEDISAPRCFEIEVRLKQS